MSFLTLSGISRHYGKFAAVDNFNLTIEKGEFISLLGPSGCGKTTTLQMIAGLVPPTAGSITLDGRDITRLAPAKRELGVVFQSYALFPHMTVAQNVSFGLEMRNVAKAERENRVREVLELVHLGALADRYPREMRSAPACCDCPCAGHQSARAALGRAALQS
jgi:putative spermidine/putrescine transport system ATP-binding protein